MKDRTEREELLRKIGHTVFAPRDIARGVVIAFVEEGSKNGETFSFLTDAGFEVVASSPDNGLLAGDENAPRDAVEAMIASSREKYKNLPLIFLCEGRGNVIFLSACKEGDEVESAALISLPSFTPEGEKALKKINGFSPFRRKNKAYPELTKAFCEGFGEPFGKLGRDTDLKTLKGLGRIVENAVCSTLPPYISVLIVSGTDSGSDAALAEKLRDCDTSLVERTELETPKKELLRSFEAKEKITDFFRSAVDGYVMKKTVYPGGAL